MLEKTMEPITLPIWVEYSKALATPAIALFALGIGYLQWRTAHQKAVMDLFERRMKIYSEIREVMGTVFREGAVDHATFFAYMRATDGVGFLFGKEVEVFLQSTHEKLAKLRYAEQKSNHGTPEERQKAIDLEQELLEQLGSFFSDLRRLLKPYLRMHQKAPSI